MWCHDYRHQSLHHGTKHDQLAGVLCHLSLLNNIAQNIFKSSISISLLLLLYHNKRLTHILNWMNIFVILWFELD